MNYQEEFGRGLAGQGLPDDPQALSAWQAGNATREERERVERANSPTAPDLPDSPSWSLEATADPPTPVSPGVAGSAVKWGLALAAFVVFAPITLPASAATLFAAPLLLASSGAPRPPFGRAAGAAFLGLLAYFAIAAGTLAPLFPASTMEGIKSLQALGRVLAPQLGSIVIFQLVAVAGYAVLAAGWLAGGMPSPGLVARTFIAAVIGLLLFVACLLTLASTLGL